MRQEDRQLLLINLCARLPYGVKVQVYDNRYAPTTLTAIDVEKQECIFNFNVPVENCLSYLRPISNMTEEEDNERKQLGILCAINSNHEKIFDGFGNESVDTQLKALDWLNAHHFDYGNLIEKGLALEAPRDMYIF